MKAKPFIKWVGGKGQLIRECHLQQPFVGVLIKKEKKNLHISKKSSNFAAENK